MSNFSTTILAVVIQLLAVGLPKLGIEVGSEALTTTISTIIVVVSGIWIWWRRYQTGDVTPLGVRK